jgi:hypothetical protein
LEDIIPVGDDDGDGEKTLDQAFYDKLTVALGERVKRCAPRVPVVTGTTESLFWGDTLPFVTSFFAQKQVILVLCLDHCYAKSEEVIRIYVRHSWLSGLRRLNYKSGKR